MQIPSAELDMQQQNTSVVFTAKQLKSSQLLANAQTTTSIKRQTAILEQSIQEAMNLPSDATIADRIRIGKKAVQKIQEEGQRTVQENAEEYLDNIKEYIKEKAQEAQKNSEQSQNTENSQNNAQETETAQTPQSSDSEAAAPASTDSNSAKQPKENNAKTRQPAKFTKQIDIIV